MKDGELLSPPFYDDVAMYPRRRRMANSNDVLKELSELKSWLYGGNGHEGDIREIKEHLKQIVKNAEHIAILDTTVFGKAGNNGLTGKVKELSNRQWKIWTLLIITASASGGIGAGIVQLFG